MAQSVIHLQCESCGGELTADSQREILICPFCGSKELIIDSEAVAVEKIRQQTSFRQWEREDNTQKEQARNAYRNSMAGVVSLIFAVVCGLCCVGCFSTARNIYMGLKGIVFLLQTASFLLSYLERKEANMRNESGNIWSFNLADKYTLSDHCFCIFTMDWGVQTCNLIIISDNFGDLAYCTGNMVENDVDSNKRSYEVKWKSGRNGNPIMFRQYRTILVYGLRSKIFRQSVQII